MNEEIKNVMTIVTIARIVESSLWYCLRPRNASGYSYDERVSRFNALTALTQEGSPFAMNCDSNGEPGKKLKEDMQYFIEDVYGNPGRIVTTDLENHVRVEPSLVIELFSTIVELRGYLEAFMGAALKALDERGTSEKELVELVHDDIRYYHAFAGKISCLLISDKFRELNENANSYAQAYSKQHNGINPQNDPEFDVRKDPSFRMLENEFHQLNRDMVAVLNSYGDDDKEFRFARESVYSDCEIFTGKKQTTDLNTFFVLFGSYFDKILDATQEKVNTMFSDMGKRIRGEEVASKEEKPQPSVQNPNVVKNESAETETVEETAAEKENM